MRGSWADSYVYFAFADNTERDSYGPSRTVVAIPKIARGAQRVSSPVVHWPYAPSSQVRVYRHSKKSQKYYRKSTTGRSNQMRCKNRLHLCLGYQNLHPGF